VRHKEKLQRIGDVLLGSESINEVTRRRRYPKASPGAAKGKKC